jgi:hypothetical protein
LLLGIIGSHRRIGLWHREENLRNQYAPPPKDFPRNNPSGKGGKGFNKVDEDERTGRGHPGATWRHHKVIEIMEG